MDREEQQSTFWQTVYLEAFRAAVDALAVGRPLSLPTNASYGVDANVPHEVAVATANAAVQAWKMSNPLEKASD